MARTHAHLTPYQFQKKTPGAPGAHREGKPTPAAPVKAIETPQTPKGMTHLAPSSTRRAAAIEILTAGRVAVKPPAQTRHEIRPAPTGVRC